MDDRRIIELKFYDLCARLLRHYGGDTLKLFEIIDYIMDAGEKVTGVQRDNLKHTATLSMFDPFKRPTQIEKMLYYKLKGYTQKAMVPLTNLSISQQGRILKNMEVSWTTFCRFTPDERELMVLLINKAQILYEELRGALDDKPNKK